jgi:hypothetical protein
MSVHVRGTPRPGETTDTSPGRSARGGNRLLNPGRLIAPYCPAGNPQNLHGQASTKGLVQVRIVPLLIPINSPTALVLYFAPPLVSIIELPPFIVRKWIRCPVVAHGDTPPSVLVRVSRLVFGVRRPTARPLQGQGERRHVRLLQPPPWATRQRYSGARKASGEQLPRCLIVVWRCGVGGCGGVIPVIRERHSPAI